MTIDPKQFRPNFIKAGLEAMDGAKNRTCRKCPNKLPSWVKYYCSQMCIEAAKASGEYGSEALQ